MQVFFLPGACFYYYRNYIKYKSTWALIGGCILFACMFQIQMAQLGIAVFGAYLLFCLAFTQISFLKTFNSYPDISYGLYLYGWPTQKLLLWYFPFLSPWLLFLFSLVIGCIMGWISWHLVERPFLALAKSKFRRLSSSW